MSEMMAKRAQACRRARARASRGCAWAQAAGMLALAACAVARADAAGPGAVGPDYRVGAAPAWVRPLVATPPAAAEAAAAVAYGVRYDLIDDQARLTAHDHVNFHHAVSEAVTEKGVDDLSHHEIEFDPTYQTLTINQVDIVRDGQRVSRLRGMHVKVLQRERDLDSRIYDGRKTVDLDLDDVRPGDTLELAYTLAGQNPVFGDHHAGGFAMQWSVPVLQLHRSLAWASDLPLHVRSRRGAVEAVASRADGFELRTWDARGVPALQREADTPEWYEPYADVEWSDFAGWGDVARWAEALYRAPSTPGPALRAVVDRIAAQDAGADARVMDVLRLVQKQVRYLGIESGASSHAPSAPELVYARRFGDCKEKALLMVTLLRALGIDAAPALVSTTSYGAIADDLPSYGSFDHVITRVRVDGHDAWLDPTRDPQGGTLATVFQPHYGKALVLDGSANALADMPAATGRMQSREIHVDVDSSQGTTQPVQYVVRTLYRGGAADKMRDELGDGQRTELQHRYVNFYAASYPGIHVAAPIEVRDDNDANTVEVTEHYAVDDFWSKDEQHGGSDAQFDVPDLDDMLKTPEEPIRTMPLALHGPQDLAVHVNVRLPDDWPDKTSEQDVRDPAFSFAKKTSIHGRTASFDYELAIGSDHVAASSTGEYAANIERARQSLGSHLWTGRDDAAAQPASDAAAPVPWTGYVRDIIDMAALVVLAVAFWRRQARAVARTGVGSAPSPSPSPSPSIAAAAAAPAATAPTAVAPVDLDIEAGRA